MTSPRPTQLLTVKELAAFLGITESGVRNIISRKQIARKGTGDHKAGLYAPADVLRHSGAEDRLALQRD